LGYRREDEESFRDLLEILVYFGVNGCSFFQKNKDVRLFTDPEDNFEVTVHVPVKFSNPN
jgi:hypothetical protein